MGKIFDALEKANKNSDGGQSSVLNSKNEPPEIIVRDKVVPIVNPILTPEGTQIDDTLIAYHAPQSVEAELFKVLRTNLLFPAIGKPPGTILVTSALPGDGKSFVSANLAISIAQGVEEYVLLIDGDIRKPSIHSRFGFGNVNGLSEYLADKCDIGKALLKTPVPKLSIMPAGKPPGNPTELISSKKMKKLLEEVKNRYDDRYIIIDSPPPSMASETNAIAQYVDGVIIVIRAEITPRAAVNDTIDQIGKEKILGIVLNQADQSSRKYYGYGKAYYQDKHN